MYRKVILQKKNGLCDPAPWNGLQSSVSGRSVLERLPWKSGELQGPQQVIMGPIGVLGGRNVSLLEIRSAVVWVVAY